jgi:hypothetical protein
MIVGAAATAAAPFRKVRRDSSVLFFLILVLLSGLRFLVVVDCTSDEIPPPFKL